MLSIVAFLDCCTANCVPACILLRYYPRGQEELTEGCPRAIMAKTATHKLVYRPEGVSEMYDLATDKRELNNVYSNPKYQEVRTAALLCLFVAVSRSFLGGAGKGFALCKNSS